MGANGGPEHLRGSTMENDTQSEKTRKASAIRLAILVMCVVGVGTVLALTGQNGSKQCNCVRPSTDPTSQTTGPSGGDSEQEVTRIRPSTPRGSGSEQVCSLQEDDTYPGRLEKGIRRQA